MSPAKPTVKDLIAAAEAAEKAGDIARAGAIYSNILAKFPKHSKAKKAMTRLKRQDGGGQRMTQADASQLAQMLNAGAFEQVLVAVGQLLVHNRKEPFLYNIQGLAHVQLEQIKPAITAYKHALRLNTNFVEARNNLGMALIKDNRPEDAVSEFKSALAQKPTYPEALHNMGVALASLERNDEALEAYNKAIAAKPDYANAYNSRGALLNAIDETEKAIEDYKTALKFMPQDAEAYSNLANVYATLGNSVDAIANAAEAARRSPGNISKLWGHAVLLNEAGDKEAARVQLEAALKIEPNHAQTLHSLATMDKADADSPVLSTLKRLINDPATSDIDTVHLGFGLGKMCEDIGAFEEGFTYLKKANDANFSLLEYDPKDEDDKFSKIKATYTKEAMASYPGTGNPTRMPILVVGMMRSGTTLVEQIISSHSQVFGAGELMAATKNLSGLSIGPGNLNPKEVDTFAAGYLHELEKRANGHAHVTDKMPANFVHVGLMKLAFPNIKIVNLVRDPRDNCYSIYKNFFDTHAHQYAYHLEYLARYANHYKDLMNHWHEVLPGAVYDCKYEDLIADQEVQSRKLLEYCELEWEPQVLEFHKTERAVRTASVNQVRQKIYKSSVRSWERVEDGLQPLISNLDPDLWSDYL